MWMVNDCLTHGYGLSLLDMSIRCAVISFSKVFDLIIMDFDLSLPVGDKLLQLNDSG